MNKYLHKFTYLSVQHRLDIFEKLITPILNYGSQVWGFAQGAQNDFVYGEVGRLNCQYVRYFIIIKYWVKYYMQTTISMLKKCITC